jgi:hypothetical protein
MADDEAEHRRKKISEIFDKLLDRYEESMHERIKASWTLVDREEQVLRLRVIQDLSVELARIREISIQATRLGETVIEDVIKGDWKNAVRLSTDLVDSCGADASLWEAFIALVSTAAAESKRIARGVVPEGN